MRASRFAGLVLLGLATSMALTVLHMARGQDAGEALPPLATWLPACADYSDDVPPLLREAWEVAAEYAGLPLEQVFFVQVGHRLWGDSYEFIYPPHRFHTCKVKVPGLEVWGAPLREAWRHPGVSASDRPLSVEDARQLGEAFIRDYLKVPLESLEFIHVAEDTPEPSYYILDWLRVQDEVCLPGFVKVHIDADTAEVVGFADLDVPPEIDLAPRVTPEQAVELVREHWNTGTQDDETRATVAAAEPSYQRLIVTYWGEDPGPADGQQRLVWSICLDVPPPAGEEKAYERPAKYTASVDAKTGEVLAARYQAPLKADSGPLPPAELEYPPPSAFRERGVAWKEAATPELSWAVNSALQEEWRPPESARVLLPAEDDPGPVRISYQLRDVRIDVGVWPREAPRALLAARFISSRKTPPINWTARDPTASILAELKSAVLGFGEAEPPPARGIGAFSDLTTAPPYEIPPIPAHKLRFRRTSILYQTKDGARVPQYQMTWNDWDLQARVVRKQPPEVYLSASH
jgi:hypothetical protein